MEPFDEGFAGFTDPSTASIYGLPAQPLDTGYYADGTQAYDRSDAGNQGGVAGTIIGGYVGGQVGGDAGALIGGGMGSGIGNVVGGYTYDALNQPPFQITGDYGTPGDGQIDPYTGISP